MRSSGIFGQAETKLTNRFAGAVPARTLGLAAMAWFAAAGFAHAATAPLAWRAAARMTTPRYGHAAALLPGGRILIAGGKHSPHGEYDPETGEDIPFAPMASCEIFDVASRSVTPAAPMNAARFDFRAVALTNGRVLAAGGAGNTAEVYDPRTNSWSFTGPMASSTIMAPLEALPGGEARKIGPVVEIYDPGSNQWTREPGYEAMTPFVPENMDSMLRLEDGRILMLERGYASYDWDYGYYYYNGRILVYDPATGETVQAGELSRPSELAAGVFQVPGGAAYLAGGGYSDYYGTYFREVDRFDPATNLVSAVSPMVNVRSEFEIVRLPDGRFLAAGGRDYDDHYGTIGAAAGCEFFDPATEIWSAAPSLGEGRHAFQLVSAGGGIVIAAGGLPDDYVHNFLALDTIEVLDLSPDLTVASPEETSGGEFGSGLTGVSDLTGDGRGDLIAGAPGETGGAEAAGRLHVVNGVTGEFVRELISPDAAASGGFGGSLRTYADLTGDRVPDILAGAARESRPERPPNSGQVHMFSGAGGGAVRTLLPPAPAAGGFFGTSVVRLGDVDFDRRQDIAAGAPGAPSSGGAAGAGLLHLFSGRTGALLRVLESPSPAENGGFGFSSAGFYDLNGDANGDAAAGAPGETPPGSPSGSGAVHVFNGVNGALLYSLQSPSPAENGDFGRAIARLFDCDYDGRLDLAAGAPRETRGSLPAAAGLVHLFRGASGAWLKTLRSPEPAANGLFGWSVDSIPDIDGDGRAEIAAGAPGESPDGVEQAGRVHLFSGNGRLIRSISSPNPEPFGFFGSTVAGVPDVNGDGLWELAAGARAEDPGASPEAAGRVYLFKSPDY